MFDFQDIKNFESRFGMGVVFTRAEEIILTNRFVIFQFYNNKIPMLGCHTSFGIEPY